MKVAYFTESLPPNTDGVVKTLCHLVDTLEAENVDFRFFSPVKPGDDYSWTRKVKKVSSVPFILYSDYRLGLPYFDGLESDLNEFQPDLIHVVSETLLGMYGLQYARKKKIRTVSSYHTHFVSYFSYYGFRRAEKLGWKFLQWFHNQTSRTYAPSPSSIEELEEQGIERCELWQRGIELDRFSPDNRSIALRKSIGADDSTPVLLFVGRLVKEKDLDDLIDANIILQERGHQFKQVIVGDGPMMNELKERLPQAHYTGYQYGKNLAEWYASSDLFVFPSTTETFGNVILEAFASGTPAVAVDKGGVADIINQGLDGLIAKSNNPLDFSDKIELLLKRDDLRTKFSRIARNTSQRYSWNEINKGLINSYETVLSN